jgi:hypothetical protein
MQFGGRNERVKDEKKKRARERKRKITRKECNT